MKKSFITIGQVMVAPFWLLYIIKVPDKKKSVCKLLGTLLTISLNIYFGVSKEPSH